MCIRDRCSDVLVAFDRMEVGKNKVAAKAAGQARAEQMNMFAKNAIIKNPDLAPPKPVMQNVGAAAFMDALSIGTKAITALGSGGFGIIGP